MTDAPTLGYYLDGDRFWADVQEQARIGALRDRGLCRLALDDADNQARLWLVAQAESLGCTAHYDDLGNVFLHREGRHSTLAPLLIGSHLDSQPRGGAYDGALGVVAGLAVLRTLQEQQVRHDRPVEVVSWTNEEGARFAPGASGSSWFAGARSQDTIVSATDGEGTSFEEALEECLALLESKRVHRRPARYVPHAFLELHIEQGPVLESRGLPVCVVSGIQGVNWYGFEINGEANHAGTTPASARRDAFLGAHDLVTALRSAVANADDELRFTIGKFAVLPGSVNTIPERVTFTIDLRHPSQAVLDVLNAEFHRLAERKWAGCTARLDVSSRVAPVAFDETLLAVLDASVSNYSPPLRLMSGAFHDAIHLARICPTAMLFAPCRNGISHHPDEHVERVDAEVAVRVLADAAGRLLHVTT